MISIITVNWNAYDFLYLLMESLEIHSTTSYQLIIVDNSIKKRPIPKKNVIHRLMTSNIGHGEGLNEGARFVKTPYTMFLDVDCHVLETNWEKPFLDLMENYDVVGGKGVPSKPIRPACMFMKSEIAKKYDWSASKGYKGNRVTPEGYDVAIKAYHQMVKDKIKIKLIESKKNRYGTLNGEEWCIENQPLIYHHWHGSHLKERSEDFPDKDLFADKELLLSKVHWKII